jgi:hypothetical protein
MREMEKWLSEFAERALHPVLVKFFHDNPNAWWLVVVAAAVAAAIYYFVSRRQKPTQ